MGALDQFSKFCAMIAGSITGARPSPAHEPANGDREQGAPSSSGNPVAPSSPAARAEEKQPTPRSSHPAVWPR